VLCLLCLCLDAAWIPEVAAQRGRRGGDYDLRPNLTRDIFPGNTFTFCRVQYTSVSGGDWDWGRRGGRRSGKWRTDYPASDLNFSQRLSELTTVDVNRDENGNIEHAIVRLTDEELRNYPFIYMLEVAELAFDEAERDALRNYLLRGGFLMVDDFWGDDAWDNWVYEIGHVLPPEEYAIVDIPLSHPLFHIVFDIKEVPQVPSVNQYRRWAQTGDTYEGQWTTDSDPHCRGIFDKKGRLMVVMMHNTDLGDGWEREGEHEGYFREFSVKRAYPMGINIVVYAMTH
jgi:hypothetical protein